MIVALIRISELNRTFRVVIDRHEYDLLLLEYNKIPPESLHSTCLHGHEDLRSKTLLHIWI
jgi:hypothetical protein